MPKTDYSQWDKEALINEIVVLKKRKKYGLVWEDKDEDVVTRCQSELPVLQEVKGLSINTAADRPTNLLIEGDNYHALSVLNYTHAGKIDVIYIDPPYNTGARDWKYNNDYVDDNDGYRHSKWLSMMANRLRLAKNLLTEDGFICVAIDHNELFALGCLLDEIFGESNRLGVVSVLINPRGRQFSSFFSATVEFYLIYARNKHLAGQFNQVVIDEEIKKSFDEKDDIGLFKWNNFVRFANIEEKLENRQKDYCYPIYVSNDLNHITLEEKSDYHKILPNRNGELKCWQIQRSSFAKKLHKSPTEYKAFREEKKIVVKKKYREQQFFTTHWVNKKYNSTFFGTRLLEKMIGKRKFDYPKSLYAVLDFLKITSKKDSTILDFFAGSGTTGHAVSLLNKQNGGNRRFILCTNNENGIAREVCHPRIKAVINGHEKLPDITGIPSNLKYYKTDFVSAAATDPNKIKLTKRATEMLCVREHTFDEVKASDSYKLFCNGQKYTGIIYNSLAIDDFKKTIAKLNGRFNVYVFSFGNVDFSEDFADMKKVVTAKPIPEIILKVYRRLFG